MDLLSIGRGPSAMGICAFCYIWNLLGAVVFHGSMVNWQGGPSVMGIYAFCYMWNLLRVMVLLGSMVNWQGLTCYGYMSILLYIKLIVRNGFAWIYGQLAGGASAMGIYAFCYMWTDVVYCIPDIYGQLEWVHLP